MRTVDAALTAALAAGHGKPFFKAYVGYSNGTVKNSHTNLIAYKLTGTTLDLWIPSVGNIASDQEQIWLERGLTIAGTDYTLTTGRFWIWDEEYLPERVTHYRGGIVPNEYYSAAGDVSYETAIDAFFTAFGKTTTYKDDTEAWLDYQFLPDGQSVLMNRAIRFLNQLQQKRLIGVCDNGAEDVRIYSADVLGSSVLTLTAQDEWSLFTTKEHTRQYIWKDENQTLHTDGAATDPLHNLGYLESTDDPPARNSATFEFTGYFRPDLRLQDGDTIKAALYGASVTATFFALVTEEYDRKSAILPKWRLKVQANPVFHTTEGGALPSTIERVANYTPLNTSSFDGILDDSDNNVQAAFETLDNHVHSDTHTHTNPGTQVSRSTAKSLNNATLTIIDFDQETFDNDAIHDNATNNSRLTCKTAGLYLVGATGEFAAHATGRRFVGLDKNGSLIYNTKMQAVTDAGATTVVQCTGLFTLAVNDYIETRMFQASGGALNVSPSLWMVKVSD